MKCYDPSAFGDETFFLFGIGIAQSNFVAYRPLHRGILVSNMKLLKFPRKTYEQHDGEGNCKQRNPIHVTGIYPEFIGNTNM